MENNKTVLDLDQLENVSGGTDFPIYGGPIYKYGQIVSYHGQPCMVDDIGGIDSHWEYVLVSFSGESFDKVPEHEISPY